MKKRKTVTIEQLTCDHGEPSAVVKAILANYRSNVEFKHRKGLVIDVFKTRGEDAAYAVGNYVGLERGSVTGWIWELRHKPLSITSRIYGYMGTLIVVLLVASALPVPKTGQCPAGYTQSGGYCAPMTDTAPAAILKVGQCPAGWVQSGAYCLDKRTTPLE